MVLCPECGRIFEHNGDMCKHWFGKYQVYYYPDDMYVYEQNRLFKLFSSKPIKLDEERIEKLLVLI